MAKTKISWLPEAVTDLQRLRTFIHQQNPTAAAKAAQRIQYGIQLLVHTPELGKPLDDDDLLDYRELFIPFGHSNYIVRYRLEHHRLIITNLWHSKESKSP